MSKKNIGFAITGSFCTHEKIKASVTELVEKGNKVTPIFSFSAQTVNCRFGNAVEFTREIESITGEKGIYSIPEAEVVGPKNLFDILIIAPCTGNTMAKLQAGITDTPVLMAAKAHIRNNKPLLISMATNDALGANFKNIACLINTKNIYFVPFFQDDYQKKPKSMVADLSLIPKAMEHALNGVQLQPVVLAPK